MQLLTSPRGDTLFVVDPVNARLSALRPDGEYLASVGFPPTHTFDAARLASGEVVINALVRDREHIGFPLHLVAPTAGGIQRSFGATADYRYDAPPLWRRRLASGTDGRVWAAQELTYVLEEWDARRGVAMAVLNRDTRLFPSAQVFASATPAQPPPTYITDISVDSSGRVWVLITVPDRDWRAGLGPEQRTPTGNRYYLPSDFDRLHDSVIEVIAPETGRVVVSTRFPQYFLRLLDDGYIAGYRLQEDGAAIDVYESRIVQP